jgi:hypothetical protein
MNFKRLSNGWFVGDVVENNSIYGDPPTSNDNEMVIFFGMSQDDKAHHLYMIPKNTPISDVVKYFKVGSHGAISYGFDSQQTINMVSEKASKIDMIIPCRVVFADPAGLKLKFERNITESELSNIESMFPEEEAMQSGLDRYISDWDGKGRLLSPVKEENMIQFWWD